MKKKKKFLIAFWLMFRNVGYLFIIQLLAYIVFTVPDQADDFVHAFIEAPDPYYYLALLILLLLWSFVNWYSSSIILDVSPTDPTEIQKNNTEIFNRFMGFWPFLILAMAFFQASSELDNVSIAILLGLICLAIGAITLMFFKWLDKQNAVLRNKKWPDTVQIIKHQNRREGSVFRTPTFREEINFIKQYSNVLFYFRTMGFITLIILISFCFPSILIPVTQFLKPASVVILSFTFITYVATVLFYFHDLNQRPFIVWIVIGILVFSLLNDNSSIPVVKKIKDCRLTPKEAFDKWYAIKCKEWEQDHVKDSMPVVFIATQGGGIRGELWTLECLNKLKNVIPGFQNQIFCMGGASGGTVGAVYYSTYCFDSIRNRKTNPELTYKNLVQFAEADGISPVTASFAFGENLQRFLPFPISCLERSKVMMKTFSLSYQNQLNSGFADSALLNLYYPHYNKDSFDVRVPSLFINGVMAETGQRIITSNLKIAGSRNFESDVDFFDYMQADITVATASLNCMRFPLLLSGGLFYKGTPCNKVGHVADGGYRENSGLQGMYSLMSELRNKFREYKVRPILIYIRNGNAELGKEDSKAIRFMHDIGTPMKALLNVNGTSVPALGIMKMMEQQYNNGNPLEMYYGDIWLADTLFKSKVKFPLGLYISEKASHYLKLRAAAIPDIDKKLINQLKAAFEVKPK